MAQYKSEKTVKVARRLEEIVSQNPQDKTLRKVAGVILEKTEFYDKCLRSWDNASKLLGADEIGLGKKCCNAGLDMAESIVDELRILFLEAAE
jgi:hypothetical protein